MHVSRHKKCIALSLIDASKKGDLTAVQTAFSSGIHITVRDTSGRTALHWAANKDIADYLIHQGADVDALDNNNQNPYQVALCSYGRAEVATYLNDYH